MSGACFLNNAAIATNRLADRWEKVALIDIDVHHGNGSQFIFYERADVLFFSLHVDPRLSAPLYAGYADETGAGAGQGLDVNYPLPWETEDAAWLQALDAGLEQVRKFAPAAIAVSVGFDAGADDPVSTFRITAEGFRRRARSWPRSICRCCLCRRAAI